MRYPVITERDAREAVEGFLTKKIAAPQIDPKDFSWKGLGEKLDLTAIESASHQVRETLAKRLEADNDLVEGEFSANVHGALSPLEATCYPALDCAGFWAFLHIQFFWDLVTWRHESTFSAGQADPTPGQIKRALKYIYDPTLKEGVLSRMYMRGSISVRNGNDYALAHSRPGSTDLWRSHITRVRTAESPEVARALAQTWADEKAWLKTGQPHGGLRTLAKLITRRRTNQHLGILSEAEANRLLDELTSSLKDDAKEA
jgi:hypothetical protein